MCGRFALKSPPAELVDVFGLDECPDFLPRYNIAPGTDIAAILAHGEGRVLRLLHWGLVPHWAKDRSMGNKLINARGETVAEKPAFRSSFRRHRCLIPATGFYEWQVTAQGKQPWYVSFKSGEPMAFAGLYDTWHAPEGGALQTACIVTIGANALMQPIHDRMPVIVARDNWNDWLSGPPDDAASLIAPCDAAAMQAWPVSHRVNRPSEEGPELAEKE